MPTTGVKTGKNGAYYAYHNNNYLGKFNDLAKAKETIELAKRIHRLKFGERRGGNRYTHRPKGDN